MGYAEKLNDPRWRRLRHDAMDADGRKCEDCGDPRRLQIHINISTVLRDLAPEALERQPIYTFFSSDHGR